MSLLRYLSEQKFPLPTGHPTTIREWASFKSNIQVERIIRDKQTGKQKSYTMYTDEDRVQIGQYAAENQNIRAVMQPKADFPNLSDSTMRSFKSKYLSTSETEGECFNIVTVTESKMQGRLLMFGELDNDVQHYIRRLS